MSVKYARKLNEIRNALSPDPLHLSELDEFFEETSDARDPHLIRRNQIHEYLQSTQNIKVLLTGHAGSGKSTELVKFQQDHGDEYAFISFSLLREAQLSQASIEVLLVLIIESIVRAVYEIFHVELSPKTLQAVYDWFSDSFKITEKDLKYTGGIGVDVNTKDTVWGKLLGVGAYLKADIKTGAHTLHRQVTKENKKLSELAYQCNLLIRDARIAVKKDLARDLVLIIEDLDKVPLAAADEIFIQNPAPLADLNCKTIFTAPIWLLTNPRSVILEAYFKKVSLPMIKVNQSDGKPCPEGRAALKELLEKRMDCSALIEDRALDLAIEKTGGVLRHLFEVLTTAAMTAEQAVKRKNRKEPRLIEADIRYGLDQWKHELVQRIGVFNLPPEYQSPEVTVEAMYERLRDLIGRPRKLESDIVNLLLLQAHAVIEYNGEGWHCVHPLVAEYIQSSS